ncbi:MAG: dTDP-4-dehydrorhamnose reductase [Ilumatobacteraceae bacterium]
MKLLVTGAGGQLGREVVDAARQAGHDVVGLTKAELDITDRSAVGTAIGAARPDVVIHTAAWTAVDACESDPDKAHLVNVIGTRNVAEAARAVSARTVYISTDYVFDGDKPSPYVEDDVPNPQSVYGRSKWEGEQEMGDDNLIVRISWVCGFHGANMVKTILKIMVNQPELRFVDDQVGNPTMADDAAAGIVRLIEHGVRGIWHLTNQGSTSWFGFAGDVLEAAGEDRTRVKPIRTADLQPPRPAKRPANSVLANTKLDTSSIAPLPHYLPSLNRLVRRLLAETHD